MLHHIVLFKGKDGLTEADRDRIRTALLALPAQIPQIASYEVVTDVGLADTNHDMALLASFADEAAWRTYQQHPAHQAVVRDVITPVLAARAAIQYTT